MTSHCQSFNLLHPAQKAGQFTNAQLQVLLPTVKMFSEDVALTFGLDKLCQVVGKKGKSDKT